MHFISAIRSLDKQHRLRTNEEIAAERSAEELTAHLTLTREQKSVIGAIYADKTTNGS